MGNKDRDLEECTFQPTRSDMKQRPASSTSQYSQQQLFENLAQSTR